ncbi:hypothetical protein NFI96_018174, partial [Prochilodus magdalenae]
NCSKGLLLPSDKCFYEEWMTKQNFTPTGPVDLKVHWEIRKDENGFMVPVIVTQWKLNDDGSIPYLKGVELQVVKLENSEQLCIHYRLSKELPGMRNQNDEQWALFVDRMVVEPGFTYSVSVANLPKPNSGYTNYNVNQKFAVPDCSDPSMKQIKFCIETGEFWQPNISMTRTGPDGRTLLVLFNSGEPAERYNVFVKCGEEKQTQTILNKLEYSHAVLADFAVGVEALTMVSPHIDSLVISTKTKDSRSFLNATFDLETWPHTCCSFNVQIQPFFEACGNDCYRKSQKFNICPGQVVSHTDRKSQVLLGICLFGLLCGLVVLAACLHYRRPPKDQKTTPSELPPQKRPVPAPERSVLIIYSRDHPQYTDIVLKLSAFLRAKCGVEVYLDLLDTTSIGVMGRLPWTEQQKRLIEQTSNKVLVLCSRGVQAKWGAMCGGPRVHLREDIHSPMGDMLTLALQLITPDMQRPASYGKYMVAYFEDISGEHDVPSMFNVAVKYKLMKHFEELYFRILDLEKYQRGRIHTIEGIGNDEYFNCPSGKALRDAIEVFQAYQLENPDWFEKECTDSEDEELPEESRLFLDQCTQPILTCEPVLNIGPPVFQHGVELHKVGHTESIWTAEVPSLNLDFSEPSVLGIQSAHNEVFSLYPSAEPRPAILTPGVYPAVLDSRPCLVAEPALLELLPSNRNEVLAKVELPVDDCSEEDVDTLQRLLQLQLSLASSQVPAPPPSMDDYNQPEEVEESEMEEASGKRQSRWSDQGYSSRDSFVREEPPASSLAALAKLQEVLYLNSPISSGFCTETMDS